MITAAFVQCANTLLRFGAWCREGGWHPTRDDLACPDLDLQPAPDGLIVVATYDKSIDAHIALGRLTAEGIDARLFDEQMVQLDWLYAIALGGIKLCVRQHDVATARRILSTDYSHELDDVDLGTPEN